MSVDATAVIEKLLDRIRQLELEAAIAAVTIDNLQHVDVAS